MVKIPLPCRLYTVGDENESNDTSKRSGESFLFCLNVSAACVGPRARRVSVLTVEGHYGERLLIAREEPGTLGPVRCSFDCP
jgi:hypothetical protein